MPDLGYTPDLLNHNLCFNKLPKGFGRTSNVRILGYSALNV